MTPEDDAKVILVGTPRTTISDAADLLCDGVTVALQDFDTETLLAIADYRDGIHKGGWMQQLIREYAEGLPGDITYDNIGEWCLPQLRSILSSPSPYHLEQRFVGAIVAAMILGAKLQETQGT